jgi:LuxR family transcriptional activator of conjugal transfer of Ti plasmids
MRAEAQEWHIDEQLLELVDALELINNEQSIKSALKSFAVKAGFEKYAYANLKGSNSQLYSNYPRDWLDRYLAGNYFEIDPVVATGKRSLEPFAWSGKHMSRHGAAVRRIAGEASEFGINSGVSIPIKAGFGCTAMLTLASSHAEVDHVPIKNTTVADTAVAFLHINLVRLSTRILQRREIPLSPRELICLAWAADGKTKIETAVMIGIKENTVRFYLEEARKKLGARNVPHAVFLAMQRNFL